VRAVSLLRRLDVVSNLVTMEASASSAAAAAAETCRLGVEWPLNGAQSVSVRLHSLVATVSWTSMTVTRSPASTVSNCIIQQAFHHRKDST